MFSSRQGGFVIGPALQAEIEEIQSVLQLSAAERAEALNQRARKSQAAAQAFAKREIQTILGVCCGG